MESIQINDVASFELVSFPLLGKVRDPVGDVSCELFFNKCYCFDSELTNGGWGLSWLIAGQINPYEGDILYNNKIFKQKERRRISQCVGMDVNNYFFLGKKTIKKQICKGLKLTKNKNAASIEKIMEIFKIDKERINRIIEHTGGMRYRASMGIGYAFDKKIYCFPWTWSNAIINFKDLWLKEIINFLKSKGCLVIIPTKYSSKMKDLFDEVIEFNHPIS